MSHHPLTRPAATPRTRLAAILVAVLAALAVWSAAAAPMARADAYTYETNVKAGEFRTLVKLWNTTATAGFTCPQGAKIRVIYGYGWFSYTRQNQTLDCVTFKTISVGAWSKLTARIQIKVPESGIVRWSYGVEG